MVMAAKVLLVDDDSKMLEGLERVLRPLQATWSVTAATSARSALELLDHEPVDVVVSDMRMPEMDGAALLTIVKEKFPATTRIILSGQTDKSAALRAIPVAHQFLCKPCPPSTLIDVLLRRARFPLSDVQLRRKMGSIDSLPCDPEIARKLSALIDEGEPGLAAVSDLIKKEPVLILKLLQLSNSSFFGVKRQVDDIAAAVSCAGEDVLRTLAASALASSSIQVLAKRADVDAMRSHVTEVAIAAHTLAGASPHADACLVAGMLHEIGKMFLATHVPEMFDAVAERASADGISFEAAELAEGAVSHAEVGAALLDLWGLPPLVVDAVAKHNHASYDCDYLDPTLAVWLAHRRVMASAR
jgi:putative nucleotidyltransferase with HDIG domain